VTVSRARFDFIDVNITSPIKDVRDT